MPFLGEALQKRAKQPLVAVLPALQKIRNVMDCIHQVAQALALLGREAVATAVRDQPCFDRGALENLETRGQERFRGERHEPHRCKRGAAAFRSTSRRMSRVAIILPIMVACSHPASPHADAPVIDRFSAHAGHLMVRTAQNHLPGPDEPIDLDRPPFITRGLGPDGTPVRYYNFDVQPLVPAPRFRFTHAGKREPIAGQADVVDVLPGDPGYSDFWGVVWVEVPESFVPGSITAASQIRGLHAEASSRALDCPIVPRGTTAREAHGVARAIADEMWYRGAHVQCLRFGDELELVADHVPTSPIYVTFGSEATFATEGGTPQTHNVVLSVPGDAEYSPLWSVHIYDRAAFDRVHDATTALAAPVVKQGPLVNCPIQSVGREP